jgi:hypothetical protein
VISEGSFPMDRADGVSFDGQVSGEEPVSNSGWGQAEPLRRPAGAQGASQETQWLPSAAPPAGPGDATMFVETPKPGEVSGGQPGSAHTVFLDARPLEPSFAWLVPLLGPGGGADIGKPIPLKAGGITTIGRVMGNDIVVPDRACSAQHARIRHEWDEGGGQMFVIYDLVSANGLYIGNKNNYKDDASRAYRHILRDGDYILLGETTFVFKQV